MSTYAYILTVIDTSVNTDSPIIQQFSCECQGQLEAAFEKECNDFGVTPTKEDFDNGYVHVEDREVVICYGHAYLYTGD